jgi:hypothetical protein
MLLPRFSYFEQSCDARNTTVNTVKNTLQFYKKKKKKKERNTFKNHKWVWTEWAELKPLTWSDSLQKEQMSHALKEHLPIELFQESGSWGWITAGN